jgi:hypothetical protein
LSVALKGKFCDWIEERQGNKARKKASVSFYYKWEGSTGKHNPCIPAEKVEQVKERVYGECWSVAEVLGFLGE